MNTWIEQIKSTSTVPIALNFAYFGLAKPKSGPFQLLTFRMHAIFRHFSRKVGQPPLLPIVARAVAQVRGLGLVQRAQLLQGALHGPGQPRDRA